jgi:phosphoribosylanthranilate isomerase
MPRTRIKICGITRPQDAELAANLGADSIGLNFFAGPRRIDFRIAYEILSVLPSLVTPVGLTSGPTTDFPEAPTIQEIQAGYMIRDVFHSLHIHTFQVYGDGFTALGASPNRGLVKLWGVYHFVDYAGLFECSWLRHFYPDLIVVDAPAQGALGGTGKKIDWSALAEANLNWGSKDMPPIILAGGLTPDNVAEAIRIAQPYAVDVSSGVEVPNQPGIKDPAKLRDFIQAVRAADADLSK